MYNRPVPDAAVDIVKDFEGWHDGDRATPNSDPILCPTGHATIGYGRVVVDPATRRPLKGAEGLARARQLYPAGVTYEEAGDMLGHDLAAFAAEIDRLVRVPINDNERSALISLAYNIGAGERGFAGPTVLRKLNKGDRLGAADAFALWNKGRVSGKLVVLPGLVRR